MKHLNRATALALSVLFIISCLSPVGAASTESAQTNPTRMTVQTKLLNGRAAPRKKSTIEARFDRGDILEATGEWSKDHKWIEVTGGETGTVWVYISYISERRHYYAKNVNYRKVKIRKWPVVGKVTGYIRRGQVVDITQTVLGWGKTDKGWVDLFYLEEED